MEPEIITKGAGLGEERQVYEKQVLYRKKQHQEEKVDDRRKEKRMAFHTQPVFLIRKKDPGMLGAFLGAVLKLQSVAFLSLFQICLEYDEGTYVFTKPSSNCDVFPNYFFKSYLETIVRKLRFGTEHLLSSASVGRELWWRAHSQLKNSHRRE